METLSRRDFVVVMAAAGGGLLLGCRIDDRSNSNAFAPNAFVRIGADGRVTLVMPQIEMGQGMYTALPMLIAEELEVGLDQVTVEQAPPNEKLYVNPLFGIQATGGSTSVRAFSEPLRKAGAAARMMLVAAAAGQWRVDPSACSAQRGVVTHGATKRTLPYGALADRAAKQPVPTEISLKDPKDFTLIGTRAKRLDTPSKVNGSAQYGIDVRVPGMKIATLAASPVVGGKVASLDEAKALSVKGVHQVVKLDDVVAVVADHMWAAKQGLAALNVTWDDGANGHVGTADVLKDIAAVSETAGLIARKDGDGAAGLARAAKRIEAVYHVPFLAHAAMEPLVVTVHVRPDACEVWTGSQVLARAQATAAEVTGLPPEKVIVHSQLIGGAFGRRLEYDYVTRAVRIAKQVEGPVKIVWTREEDMQQDVYRPYYYDRIAAGLDTAGKPVAWTHRITGPSILARFLPPAFKNGLDGDALDTAAQMLYEIPAVQIEYLRHEEPVLNTGFWRGVGNTHNDFVMESFIDELAAAAKADPVAYRRALLTKSPRALAVLDLATEKAGWGQPLPAGHGRGVALLYCSWNTYMAQVAEVEVSPSHEIRVHRVVCACDCGQMVNPDIVTAQMEGGIIYGLSGALWGEVTLKNGRVEQSNFTDYRVMRMNESPVIETHLVVNHEKPGGMGEPATACIAPAVANAVYAVTGKRIRQLPLQPALTSVA
ncbi:MAG TPA: xanthine dehydrogenase family protein molybdopterin-binding subunit [Gemmatimonadaceae bacterium]|nr:xanthine dehydrogenase family protein molybdopterin-binding subunit [Gemmatimonadaceae bacterium]